MCVVLSGTCLLHVSKCHRLTRTPFHSLLCRPPLLTHTHAGCGRSTSRTDLTPGLLASACCSWPCRRCARHAASTSSRQSERACLLCASAAPPWRPLRVSWSSAGAQHRPSHTHTRLAALAHSHRAFHSCHTSLLTGMKKPTMIWRRGAPAAAGSAAATQRCSTQTMAQVGGWVWACACAGRRGV